MQHIFEIIFAMRQGDMYFFLTHTVFELLFLTTFIFVRIQSKMRINVSKQYSLYIFGVKNNFSFHFVFFSQGELPVAVERVDPPVIPHTQPEHPLQKDWQGQLPILLNCDYLCISSPILNQTILCCKVSSRQFLYLLPDYICIHP